MYTKYIPHPPLSAIIGKDVNTCRKKHIEKWKIILLCGSSNHVEVANNGINKHLYANLNLPILTVMVADL